MRLFVSQLHSEVEDLSVYRADIDGLRAVAVGSVVAYHYGVHSIPGGFVGVDIFFVISGFLISSIIIDAVSAGSFSFSMFYARRARRILPAFVFVTLATIVAGYFIILPIELNSLAISAIYSLLFSGNIFFYLSSDYFSPSATSIPLLHYWSLGIEEQFYFVLPALIIGLTAIRQRAIRRYLLPAAIALLLVASLVLAQAQLYENPAAAFYLLPARAWELLAGTMAALVVRRGTQIPRSIAYAMAIAGAGLIVGSLLLLSTNMRFPGVSAVPVVLGTALVIVSGARGTTAVHQLLGTLPFRWLGRISYSLYLVHWPVMVYAIQLYPDAPPDLRAWAALAVTVAITLVSFFGIEEPARKGRLLRSTGRALTITGGLAAAALCLAIFVRANEGFPGRIGLAAAHYSSFLTGRRQAFGNPKCFKNINESYDSIDLDECLPRDASKAVVLWGDSGIAQYVPYVKRSIALSGLSTGQITASACPPLLGIDIPDRPQCREYNDRMLEKIISYRPKAVILGEAWSIYMEKLEGLSNTLTRLESAGIKVVVLGVGPVFSKEVPAIMAKRAIDNDPSLMSDDQNWNNDYVRKINARLGEISKSHGAAFISVLENICPDDVCVLSNGADPYYFDRYHVTSAGGEYHAAILTPLIVNELSHP